MCAVLVILFTGLSHIEQSIHLSRHFTDPAGSHATVSKREAA
jgi:hypothetical protein